MTTKESSNTTEARPLPPHAAVMHMATGFVLSQALIVAAELGIADLVGEAPRTAQELAAATGTQEDALYRLLRFLASDGVFAEDHARRFHLTPLAAVLRSGVPDSHEARRGEGGACPGPLGVWCGGRGHRRRQAWQPHAVAGEAPAGHPGDSIHWGAHGRQRGIRRCGGRRNVELTMANIRKHSQVIAELEQAGAVKIAGAFYDLKTGAVEFFA